MVLDFFRIVNKPCKNGVEMVPVFVVRKSKDLMIRGSDFYAVWVDEKKLWSTEEDDVISLIDHELDLAAAKLQASGVTVTIKYMWDASSGVVDSWHKYCQKQMRDNYRPLDEKLIFSNTETKKEDYASKKLPYALLPCDTKAYDEIMSVLYSEDERRKIEWSIGAIVSGDSKKLQKFIVFYGEPGTGKSTVMNIIQDLFEGYWSVFDAKALGNSNNSFALEAFKKNPLVAIQQDGDLSHIEDNTRLNSLVAHEVMSVNEKYKTAYENRFISFLYMGTNKPVKITDGKSGLLRRLIDVNPTGKKIPQKRYFKLVEQVKFELGGIASHCLDVYNEYKSAYNNYVPLSMMSASNDFYNFMLDSYHKFLEDDGVSLKVAWEMYNAYVESANAFKLSQRVFKEELKNYFREFLSSDKTKDGCVVYSYYKGFRTDKFFEEHGATPEVMSTDIIQLTSTESFLDEILANCPAQYATEDKEAAPTMNWERVRTTLYDIDTHKCHYVQLDTPNHIVIDFDIKDENGEKNLQKNLEAASKWPATYAELSRGGKGIHLHYYYNGDVSKLCKLYDEDIEIKVYTGKSSLRRRLTFCRNIAVAVISSGLPLKGDKVVVSDKHIKTEKKLRSMIQHNLNKEYTGYTVTSMQFIKKILDDCYASGLHYDISNMYDELFAFAINSTHSKDECLKILDQLKLHSDDTVADIPSDKPIVFFDCEVFPNLLLVNWKVQGKDNPVVRMINPSAEKIAELTHYRLVGFNNRKYDNHILYARIIGYSIEDIYQLSKSIIAAETDELKKNVFFGDAYNLSYTDIYDFAAKKQSLKKWEIELGIHHQELGLPWDQPVPEGRWEEVAEYCDNDVLATEAVFDHLKADFAARCILADLAGMSPNATTNQLTTKIIFGNERHPKLRKIDLAETFPGYEFVK